MLFRSEHKNYTQQMHESNRPRLLEGSLLDRNSTLESLIKWTALIVAAFFCLQEVREWRSTYDVPTPSITNGCEVPANLMNKRNLPKALPIGPSPTYNDQIQWYEKRINQLEEFSIDLVLDRGTLTERCR